MKYPRNTGILGVLLVACASYLGCLAEIMQQGTSGARLVDYALAENGATVSASMSTSNHQPETIINGITSSDNWSKGEGWKAEFERQHLKDNWRSWQWDTARAEARGGAWIEVGFPEPKRVNRIVIHTLDSEAYPASKVWRSFGCITSMVRRPLGNHRSSEKWENRVYEDESNPICCWRQD